MLYNDHLSSVLQLSVSTLSQNEVFNDVRCHVERAVHVYVTPLVVITDT